MRIIQWLVVGALVSCSAVQAASAAQGKAVPNGLGLGVILGEPTGLSVKKWLGGKTAIDGAAAWAFSGHSSFQVHGDYLYHVYHVLNVSGIHGRLPFYYGIGGRLKFHDERDGNTDTRVGVRIPLGLTYLHEGAPFDLFVEIVPVLDVAPSSDLRLNAAVGGRYYF